MSFRDDMEFMHCYYVASTEQNLDRAWIDGKQRAAASLERQIKSLEDRRGRILGYTRQDYERAWGVNVAAAETEDSNG